MLLNHSEKLERRATRRFSAGFPLLDRTFAGVEIAGEHGLTDIVGLAQPLDLRRLDLCRHDQVARVEIAHSCLVRLAVCHFLNRHTKPTILDTHFGSGLRGPRVFERPHGSLRVDHIVW